MKRSDIDRCVDVFEKQPDFETTYGGQKEALRQTLKRIVGLEGFLAFLFEVILEEEVQLLGVGGIAFLNSEFVDRAKQSPYPWIGPTLMQQLLAGETPLLSDSEVRRENTVGGLTVYAWPFGFAPNTITPEFMTFMMVSFIEELRGYNLKEFLGQAPDGEALRAMLRAGGELFTPEGTFVDLPEGEEGRLLDPHLVVITRKRAFEHVGNWASALFLFRSPVIGFSRSEQHLLEDALRGSTDEDVATERGISISAVKKKWRLIYDRVERSQLRILPSDADVPENGDRGKGKKHRLLAYLREHHEELRPISVKLLRQGKTEAEHIRRRPLPTD